MIKTAEQNTGQLLHGVNEADGLWFGITAGKCWSVLRHVGETVRVVNKMPFDTHISVFLPYR